MKILLDEHLPYALARSFPDDWDIRSTQRMGWKGKENGELLQLAAARGVRCADHGGQEHAAPAEPERSAPGCRAPDLQLARAGPATARDGFRMSSRQSPEGQAILLVEYSTVVRRTSLSD